MLYQLGKKLFVPFGLGVLHERPMLCTKFGVLPNQPGQPGARLRAVWEFQLWKLHSVR
jgi:hypothetical protein